ncbi:MAG: tetratricopeptide repeat protein, partial [bacterium]
MLWQYTKGFARQANAEKALSLRPNLARAHEAMGNYYYHGKLNYEAALREYNEAIRLQPNSANAYAGIG